eukprot:g3173.t1
MPKRSALPPGVKRTKKDKSFKVSPQQKLIGISVVAVYALYMVYTEFTAWSLAGTLDTWESTCDACKASMGAGVIASFALRSEDNVDIAAQMCTSHYFDEYYKTTKFVTVDGKQPDYSFTSLAVSACGYWTTRNTAVREALLERLGPQIGKDVGAITNSWTKEICFTNNICNKSDNRKQLKKRLAEIARMRKSGKVRHMLDNKPPGH